MSDLMFGKVSSVPSFLLISLALSRTTSVSTENSEMMNSAGHGFLCGLLFGDRMIVLAQESHESGESCAVELVEAGVKDGSEVTLSLQLSLCGTGYIWRTIGFDCHNLNCGFVFNLSNGVESKKVIKIWI